MEKHVVKRADYPDISALKERFQKEYQSLHQQLREGQSALIIAAQESFRAHGQWEGPAQQQHPPHNSPLSTGSPHLTSTVDIDAQLKDILQNPATEPIPSFKDPAQDTAETSPTGIKLRGPLIIVIPEIGQVIITVTQDVLAAFQEVEQTQQALEELDTSWRQAIRESQDTYIDQEIRAMGTQRWLFAGLAAIGDSYVSNDFLIFVKSDVRYTEPVTYKRVSCDLVVAELSAFKKDPEKWTQDSEAMQELIYERRAQQAPQLFEEALVSIISAQEGEGWYCLFMLAEDILFIRNIEQ